MAATTIVENIAKLIQVETDTPKRWVAGAAMAHLETLDNAYLLMEDGKITDFGPREEAPQAGIAKRIDAQGGMVFPAGGVEEKKKFSFTALMFTYFKAG